MKGVYDTNSSILVFIQLLKVLGLDICADTIVGNNMLRGISGGQKKRVTTGNVIFGANKVLDAYILQTYKVHCLPGP